MSDVQSGSITSERRRQVEEGSACLIYLVNCSFKGTLCGFVCIVHVLSMMAGSVTTLLEWRRFETSAAGCKASSTFSFLELHSESCQRRCPRSPSPDL